MICKTKQKWRRGWITRRTFLAVGQALMAIFWPISGFKRRTFHNSRFLTKRTLNFCVRGWITRKKFLAVGQARMAIFWPTSGFKGRTFHSWFLTKGTLISSSADHGVGVWVAGCGVGAGGGGGGGGGVGRGGGATYPQRWRSDSLARWRCYTVLVVCLLRHSMPFDMTKNLREDSC